MNRSKAGLGAVIAVAVLWALPLAAQRPEAPARSEPSVLLLKVGTADVAGGQRVTVEEPLADLFGRAWDYEGGEFYALLRPPGDQRWYVGGFSVPEPGGVFNVTGVRFPQAGEFEVLVALLNPSSLTVGERVEESRWRAQARAASERVLVNVEIPPSQAEEGAEEGALISIMSVANVGVSSREVTPVPASGDVVIKLRGKAEEGKGRKVYLAVHIPYTDKCRILGPAGKGETPNVFTLQSVSLDAPGDPQQMQLELVAFSSERPVRVGPTSWQSFTQAEFTTSPTVMVVVEGKRPRSDSPRVPFLAITRVGRHVLGSAQEEGRGLSVGQGELLEVSEYERFPDGALPFVLTRPHGSNVWLVQGPLIPRGSRIGGDDDTAKRPLITWVLPGLRFERPDKRGPSSGNYEVMAVLSTATYPNSWIASSSLSSKPIESVSQLVSVRVGEDAAPAELHLSITHVSGQETDPAGETLTGPSGSVHVDTQQELPKAYKVYVGKHPVGTPTWSFVEALENGSGHTVPDLSFTNPHAQEGTRYQLVAIVTDGTLPLVEVEYQDFLQHALATSEIVTVRYGKEPASGFLSGWFAAPAGEPAPPGPLPAQGKEESGMWGWLLFGLLVLALLTLLEWGLGTVSYISGKAADRIDRGRASSEHWFVQTEKINIAGFLLGVAILLLVLYVIQRYYITLYAAAIATVTTLPPQKSAGLAVWLILLTALLGVFIDLAFQRAWRAPQAEPGQHGEPGQHTSFYRGLGYSLIGVAVLLMGFQALLYYSLFRKTAGGILPPLGGIAFFLIAAVEAVSFFFITDLMLGSGGAVVYRCGRMPFAISALGFRFMQRLFETVPRRKKQERTKEQRPREAGEDDARADDDAGDQTKPVAKESDHESSKLHD